VSAKDPNQDFGANEWLVDEMYERYVADPTSVEPSWIEFFKTYTPNNSSGNSAGATSAPIAGAPRGGVPPTPKAASAAPSATPV
jgi:2-oxoglutarate dehydrogenase E1 component